MTATTERIVSRVQLFRAGYIPRETRRFGGGNWETEWFRSMPLPSPVIKEGPEGFCFYYLGIVGRGASLEEAEDDFDNAYEELYDKS